MEGSLDVERTTLRSTASKSDRLSQASVAMKVGASECRGDGIAAGIGTQWGISRVSTRSCRTKSAFDA